MVTAAWASTVWFEAFSEVPVKGTIATRHDGTLALEDDATNH
jgi:hypothetical protein